MINYQFYLFLLQNQRGEVSLLKSLKSILMPHMFSTQRTGKQPVVATTCYSLRSLLPSEPKVKIQSKPATRGPDPLTALLKEKRQAAKRGNGRDAIEKAELAVFQYGGKGTLLDEMEGEEVEEGAEWGTNISSVSVRDILNARSEKKDESDLELDERDKERIREAEGGKTVLKILEQDKAERFKTGNDNNVSGIRLWAQKTDAESSAMAVDENYRVPGDSPVVRLLNNSLECGGTSLGSPLFLGSVIPAATDRTSSLLNMNIISAARPADRAAIASRLLDISMLEFHFFLSVINGGFRSIAEVFPMHCRRFQYSDEILVILHATLD